MNNTTQPNYSFIVTSAWTSLFVLLFLLMWHCWFGPDIWYHLSLGRGILNEMTILPSNHLIIQQQGQLNTNWLFQVIIWIIYSLSGTIGITFFFFILWLSSLFFFAKTSNVVKNPLLGLPLILMGILVCQTRFEERPEIISYVLLSLQLFLLNNLFQITTPTTTTSIQKTNLNTKQSPKTQQINNRHNQASSFTSAWRSISLKIWILLIISEIIWVNCHSYFFLGPAIVGMQLLFAWFENNYKINTKQKALFLLLIGLILATLVNPFGINIFINVIQFYRMLNSSEIGIAELHAPTGKYLGLWTIILFWIYFCITCTIALGSILWIGIIKKNRTIFFRSALALIGLYLGASSQRNIPFAIFMSAPLWHKAMSIWKEIIGNTDISNTKESKHYIIPNYITIVISATATLIIAIWLNTWIQNGGFYRSLGHYTNFGINLENKSYPIYFSEYLKSINFNGRLFNHPSDGGYLEYHIPKLNIYADSRFIDSKVVNEYFDALFSSDKFKKLNDTYHFDALLMNIANEQQGMFQILEDPNWKLMYADLHRAFVVDSRIYPNNKFNNSTPHLKFYHGEDLSNLRNGSCAINWIYALGKLNKPDFIITALRDFSNSAIIPSPVIYHALSFGIKTQNVDVVKAAASLAPKMLALNSTDADALNQILSHNFVLKSIAEK